MRKNIVQIKSVSRLMLVAVFVGLSACSSVDNALDTTTAVKYSNNISVAVLKSPKGLVPPEYDMTFALPETDVNSKQSAVVDIRPPDLIK